ncbi:MAG TPA: phosphatidylserine/phosphatidylglycerophosphate/cardiolipin synthase family protein, partial [Polyangiaceae bacterium]|nr:phosphatidylserine/phosphatidylglycerophosphate/cardiolipin synthase family protein [Polyangiaceae bacterium]
VRIEEPGEYLVTLGDAAGGDYRLRLACSGGACARPWLDDAEEPCALSPLGQSVLDAALAAEPSRNSVPPSLMVTYENRTAGALVTGPVVFPAMADAIAGAEHEVDLAMFVFNHSDAYEEITDAIARLEARRRAAAAETPVIVRILVDAQKILFNTGSKIAKRAFEGVGELALDPNYVQVQIATYEHFTLGNLHSKLLVVDGKTVMLGGANIQKQHDYAAPWMDSFYVLEGRSAQSFLADFDHAWNKSKQWHCVRNAEGEPDCQGWSDAPPAWHEAVVLEPEVMVDSCVPAIALNRTAWGGFNNNIDNPQDQGILAALDGAQQRIRMQTPNLNDDAVKDAILRAVARGVEVEIVLSLGFNDTAMHLFGGTNEENADELMARAQNAENLQIRWYSADGVAPIDGNVTGASHLKYLSIDGQLAVVGSTNMDTLAWNHSRETNVAVDRASITSAWDARVFEPNWTHAVP